MVGGVVMVGDTFGQYRIVEKIGEGWSTAPATLV
jgi:hypothetical protein